MSLHVNRKHTASGIVAQGWILDYEGFDAATKHYFHVAYVHPDDPTVWFGARSNEPATQTVQGGWIHRVVISAVKGLLLPPMMDDELWVIDYDEFLRLHDLEMLWWDDYDMERYYNPVATDQECVDAAHDQVVNNNR